MLIPTFAPDFPDAIVVPAEADNVYAPAGHGGVPNKPRAFVLHTPEEPADNYPGTPRWFQQYHPERRGSTHYFVSWAGDVYQCVPESWGAIANGFNPGNPQRLSYPSWAGGFSLNWQTLSVEIEGYAHNIHNTMIVDGPQWTALAALIRHRCAAWEIPLDREHIPGHYQLSVDRTDPGAKFPWDALMAALTETEEDEMKPILVWDKDRKRTYVFGPFGAVFIPDPEDGKQFERLYGGHQMALSAATIDALVAT